MRTTEWLRAAGRVAAGIGVVTGPLAATTAVIGLSAGPAAASSCAWVSNLEACAAVTSTASGLSWTGWAYDNVSTNGYVSLRWGSHNTGSLAYSLGPRVNHWYGAHGTTAYTGNQPIYDIYAKLKAHSSSGNVTNTIYAV